MGRKAASTSTHGDRQLVCRSARKADRQRLAHARRSRRSQSLHRRLLEAAPKTTIDPGITDDFPAFVAVLERELDTIEAYLAASLDGILGRLD